MSLIRAEDSYCNACAENGKYRSTLLLTLPADSDGNAVEGDDKNRSAMSLIIADNCYKVRYVIDYSCRH